jgi:regulator of protease activity HflC (stomatin/prohibitin superfamily)
MSLLESLVLLALVAAGALLVAALVLSTTVFEYERALRFVHGSLRDEVGPGRYLHLRTSTVLRKVDLRPALMAVNAQEVLSRDGVAVKASLSATYRVTSVRTAIVEVADYAAALYTELQQALRVAVSGADVEALLANRAELGPQILRDVQPRAARLGLEVETVAIRDLTLPGELKKIFAQVVKARQEGLAALERARGETAALRHLANAARMVERNPQLLQLRLLQVAGQQSSMTMVVGIPPGTTPLPIGDAGAASRDLPPDGGDAPV